MVSSINVGKCFFIPIAEQPPRKYPVTANTSFVIATTGLSQPTTNALGTISFTTGGSASNASHSGWVTFISYTDAFGNPREKSEVLVALSKNGITNDDEDTKFPD